MLKSNLIKRGVLDASQSKADMVGEASRFYGVANVDAWKDVSKWLSPSKAMILVSLRGKEEDLFWFSFFHEAYHILHGEKKRLYIAEERSSDEEEQKAGGFAAQILIPKEWNEAISRILTKEEVVSIAKQLSISPGIVAGRYRHLTGRWSYFKDLTRSYCWDESIGKTKVQS